MVVLPFIFLGNTFHFSNRKKVYLALPVEVSATGGTAYKDYLTLKEAFTAINNGIHKGTITLNISGNTTETAAAVLNGSGTSGGSGTSSYTAINIQPSGGGVRTILGNIAGALIDLNGADNVTIDGLNAGGNSLIMDNQNITSASTIRLKADALNVTIKKCTLKSAGDNLAAAVFLSTSTTVGNDNFWIDDCDITASSTGKPTQAIYFNASDKTDNVKVTNCRIYDFHSTVDDVYGIRIGTSGLGTGCEITGNSFYETESRYLGVNKNFYFIGVKTDFITDLTIHDNYFGGQAVNGGSSLLPLKLTGFGVFSGVYLDIGTNNTASIQNNQIKNIDFTTTSGSTYNALIALPTGSFDCGNITGNTIGEGVKVKIGGSLIGILAGTGTPKTMNIFNNTISGVSVAGGFKGISANKSASYTIQKNKIYDNTITSGSTLTGIFFNAAPPTSPLTTSNIITGNIIHDLLGDGGGDVYGIEYNDGGTNNDFAKNNIYDLITTGVKSTDVVTGIYISSTTNDPATFSNNMIVLGNSMTNGATIYGFNEKTAVCNYYNNSVYIGGTGVISVGKTYTFYSTNTTNAHILKNNIFANMRTNTSGSAANYSILLTNTAPLSIDHNLYFGNTATGSGYKMGKYGSTDYTHFCAWQAALGTGKETSSLFRDPKFIDPTGTIPNLHLQTTNSTEGKGVAISGITTDFDGNTRTSTPDIGADEANFTLEPSGVFVSLTPLTSPICSDATAITLLGGSPSGGSFIVNGLSNTSFTPSAAGAGTHTISYFYSNLSDICNTVSQTIVVNAQPTTPSVSNVNYCVGETAVALSATGSNLKWYTVASGGTSDATAPTPSTTSAGATSFYVSQTTNNCESPRAQINIVVNAIPATPSVSNVNYCVGETAVALSATGSNLKWYTVASGGTSDATAPTPSTASAGTTSFYASQTTNNCESPRAQINVGVNAIPATPSVANVNYCVAETAVALSATGSNLKWYTVASGGTSDATAPTPSTTSGGATSFYVSQTTNNCESPRAQINIVVNAIPATPSVSNINYCVGETAVALSATGSNLKWYTVASGGTSDAAAPTPSTTSTGTTSFYASQTTNNCESPRAKLDVVVNPIPTIPTVANVSYCIGETATALTATGSNLKWYTTVSGGGSNPTAPIPSTTSAGISTYYVSQSDNYCESPRCIIQVTIDEITVPANAGTNLTNATGNFIITGNTPVAGTGKWSLVSGTATIADVNAATTTITSVPDNTTAVLRWTITNGACTSMSDMTLRRDPALPLTLLQFEVKSEPHSNILTWRTADEKNVKGFDLQRSTDNKGFKSIGWRDAKGNSIYSYEDKNIATGVIYYYRLQMIDIDGRFEYSPIKSVSIEGETTKPKIYPNPAADEAFLTFSSPIETTGFIKCHNALGQIVFTRSAKLNLGENTIPLDINSLSAGLYFMIFEANDKRFSMKMSKN